MVTNKNSVNLRTVDLEPRRKEELPKFKALNPFDSSRERNKKGSNIVQDEIEKQLDDFNKSGGDPRVLRGHSEDSTICINKQLDKGIVIDHGSDSVLKITEFELSDIVAVDIYIHPDEIRHSAANTIFEESDSSITFRDKYVGGYLGQIFGAIASKLSGDIFQSPYEFIGVLRIKLRGKVKADYKHMHVRITPGEGHEHSLARDISRAVDPKLRELLIFVRYAFDGKVKFTNVLW